MKRLRLMLSLALMCAIAVTGMPQFAQAASSKRGNEMMRVINNVRANAGLRPLQPSDRLVRSSRARSELMMQADFFAHPAQLRVPTFDRVGEVLELHGGHAPQPRNVLERWLNSYGHRAVLTGRYRHVGAARAIGRYNGRRATIWVVRVGNR